MSLPDLLDEAAGRQDDAGPQGEWQRERKLADDRETQLINQARERNSSASRCPAMYAERAIGSERRRSTMPSVRSVAIETAGPIIPNASVCTSTPPIRYSR